MFRREFIDMANKQETTENKEKICSLPDGTDMMSLPCGYYKKEKIDEKELLFGIKKKDTVD